MHLDDVTIPVTSPMDPQRDTPANVFGHEQLKTTTGPVQLTTATANFPVESTFKSSETDTIDEGTTAGVLGKITTQRLSESEQTTVAADKSGLDTEQRTTQNGLSEVSTLSAFTDAKEKATTGPVQFTTATFPDGSTSRETELYEICELLSTKTTEGEFDEMATSTASSPSRSSRRKSTSGAPGNPCAVGASEAVTWPNEQESPQRDKGLYPGHSSVPLG